jgi:transcriptional regulator with XRE-family HTH domain
MHVKTLRQSRGWSQEVLAELSGLSVRTIQRVERGEPASQDTITALAHVFEEPLPSPSTGENMTEHTIMSTDKHEIEGTTPTQFYTHLSIFVLIHIALVFINLTLTPSFYWVVITLLGWGAGLIGHAIMTFKPFSHQQKQD